MKKFNNFKMTILALVIMPLALIGGPQQLKQKDIAVELGIAATIASWTGIYGCSKVSEKIADKLNLGKTARFFKGASHCAALPLRTGLGVAMFAVPACIATYMIDKHITQMRIEKSMSELTEKL